MNTYVKENYISIFSDTILNLDSNLSVRCILIPAWKNLTKEGEAKSHHLCTK